tara:strand:+ start:713 stop:814 length:102 start_codon:yes stop_codon:yes gene_type:complete
MIYGALQGIANKYHKECPFSKDYPTPFSYGIHL